jgi:hypothetical protein
MLPNYGEGKDNAVRRLQEEIDKSSKRPESRPNPSIMIPFSHDEDFIERQTLLNRSPKIVANQGLGLPLLA